MAYVNACVKKHGGIVVRHSNPGLTSCGKAGCPHFILQILDQLFVLVFPLSF